MKVVCDILTTSASSIQVSTVHVLLNYIQNVLRFHSTFSSTADFLLLATTGLLAALLEIYYCETMHLFKHQLISWNPLDIQIINENAIPSVPSTSVVDWNTICTSVVTSTCADQSRVTHLRQDRAHIFFDPSAFSFDHQRFESFIDCLHRSIKYLKWNDIKDGQWNDLLISMKSAIQMKEHFNSTLSLWKSLMDQLFEKKSLPSSKAITLIDKLSQHRKQMLIELLKQTLLGEIQCLIHRSNSSRSRASTEHENQKEQQVKNQHVLAIDAILQQFWSIFTLDPKLAQLLSTLNVNHYGDCFGTVAQNEMHQATQTHARIKELKQTAVEECGLITLLLYMLSISIQAPYFHHLPQKHWEKWIMLCIQLIFKCLHSYESSSFSHGSLPFPSHQKWLPSIELILNQDFLANRHNKLDEEEKHRSSSQLRRRIMIEVLGYALGEEDLYSFENAALINYKEIGTTSTIIIPDLILFNWKVCKAWSDPEVAADFVSFLQAVCLLNPTKSYQINQSGIIQSLLQCHLLDTTADWCFVQFLLEYGGLTPNAYLVWMQEILQKGLDSIAFKQFGIYLASQEKQKQLCTSYIEFEVASKGYASLHFSKPFRSCLSSLPSISNSFSSASPPCLSWPPSSGYTYTIWLQIHEYEENTSMEQQYQQLRSLNQCIMCRKQIKKGQKFQTCGHGAW